MVTRVGPGEYVFELFLPRAQRVALSGSFNQWSTQDQFLERDPDGWWRATVCLPEGDHSFQYVIDDHEWLADFAAGGIERNGFGCWVSLLSVRNAQTRQRSVDREFDDLMHLLAQAKDRLRDTSPRSLPFEVVTDEDSDCDPAVPSVARLARMVA